MSVIALACAAWALGAVASDWLVGSGLAVHLNGESHCNKWVTAGAGVEHELGDGKRLVAGVYSNSNCNTSLYAAAIRDVARLGMVRLGGFGGAVTGYGSSVLPVAGLAATIEGERVGVNAIFIPPYRGSGNVLWLQLKRKF